MLPASDTGIAHQDVGRAFSERRKARGVGGFVVGHRWYTATSEVIDWAAEENEQDPWAALNASLDGFFADRWAAEKRYPYGAWVADPGRWMPCEVALPPVADEEADRRERIRLQAELEMLEQQAADGLDVGRQIAELRKRLGRVAA